MLPSAFVCLAVFILCLNSFCGRDHDECHVLLGPRGERGRATWNGWAGRDLQGLLLAQNIAAWLYVAYLCLSATRCCLSVLCNVLLMFKHLICNFS